MSPRFVVPPGNMSPQVRQGMPPQGMPGMGGVPMQGQFPGMPPQMMQQVQQQQQQQQVAAQQQAAQQAQQAAQAHQQAQQQQQQQQQQPVFGAQWGASASELDSYSANADNALTFS